MCQQSIRPRTTADKPRMRPPLRTGNGLWLAKWTARGNPRTHLALGLSPDHALANLQIEVSSWPREEVV